MTTTMEQVVTQLQQELFSLRAKVTAQSRLAEAVRAINNRATAQVRKDTPSLSDVNGLGRPKDFSWQGKGFPTVVEEDGRFLRWNDQGSPRRSWRGQLKSTEITAKLINREFLLTATNQERGVQNLEVVLQQMHTALMAPTSCEANDMVSNSRKNPLEAWRRLQKRYDPTSHAHFSRDLALFWNSKRESNAGSPTTTRSSWLVWRRRYRRSLRNT